MDLGERKSPSSNSGLREARLLYGEPLSDMRVPLQENGAALGPEAVLAASGRAGEMTNFFNSLPGIIYLPPSRPLFNTRT